VTTPGDAYLASLPRPARRAHGAFYTPGEIVDYVVAETLALLGAPTWRGDGSARLRVLDPAAGDGRFLAAAADRLSELGGKRTAIVRRCLVAVDRDPAAATLARAALPGAEVRIGEALLGGLVDSGSWDVILSNPPWVRSIAIKREDPALWSALRGAFAATSYKEWDLYGAFLERVLDWLAPGGAAGLVLPSRWLTGAFAEPLRERLGRSGALTRIVDFGSRQVFAGATTYTALVFLQKPRAGRRGRGLEVARFVGPLSHRPERAPLPPEGPDWRRGRIPLSALGRAPWALAVGDEALLLDRLRAGGPPLAEVARISKGAGTNADPVFVVPLARARAEGLEEDALIPCLRGRDVRELAAPVTHLALLPYDGDRLLAPDELASRWPRAFRYLQRHRELLERRERRRFAGPTFYRWGRPQNLMWLRDRAPKVVVPDATRGGRAALDREGRLCLDTAYAVRPRDDRTPIGLLLAVLASPVVGSWLGATGVPLRGGYFRMKTAYLASLPIPDPGTRAARAVAAAALSGAADAEQLGRQVMALYGL
jgi:hypothetical protein